MYFSKSHLKCFHLWHASTRKGAAPFYISSASSLVLLQQIKRNNVTLLIIFKNLRHLQGTHNPTPPPHTQTRARNKNHILFLGRSGLPLQKIKKNDALYDPLFFGLVYLFQKQIDFEYNIKSKIKYIILLALLS